MTVPCGTAELTSRDEAKLEEDWGRMGLDPPAVCI